MKTKISFLIVSSVLATIVLSGCTDITTEGVTGITYYPIIEVAGDPVVYLPTGSEYVDAGASAIENGEATEVKVTSNVDTSEPGSYTVNYSATNVDGFSKTAKRRVIVYDANMSTDDISGTYTGHVIRNADPNKEYSGIEVTLTPADIPGTTGIYEISDWVGGFYAVGYGYGDNYTFTGLIQINGDNEVVELSMANAFGEPFDYVDGTYDPGTGVVAYEASWIDGTYIFAVDLTP